MRSGGVADTLKSISVPSAETLVHLLRSVVVYSSEYGATSEYDQSASDAQKKNQSQGNSGVRASETSCFNDGLTLMQSMAHLRCLMVQLTELHASATNRNQAWIGDLTVLIEILMRDLPNLVSIAATDPVAAVTMAFSCGVFKGAQLDVLKNLLKEGDVCFLEKISIRIWRQLRRSQLDRQTGKESTAANQMVPVAGEVQVVDNRVRALTHFPTVKLPGVSIVRMTGRWFYECTLLTEGLMQIGWADSQFRCDPVRIRLCHFIGL